MIIRTPTDEQIHARGHRQSLPLRRLPQHPRRWPARRGPAIAATSGTAASIGDDTCRRFASSRSRVKTGTRSSSSRKSGVPRLGPRRRRSLSSASPHPRLEGRAEGHRPRPLRLRTSASRASSTRGSCAAHIPTPASAASTSRRPNGLPGVHAVSARPTRREFPGTRKASSSRRPCASSATRSRRWRPRARSSPRTPCA